MASLKNSPCMYALEQQDKKNHQQYLLNQQPQIPYQSKYAGFGTNVGAMKSVTIIIFYQITLQILKVIFLILEHMI